MGLWSTAWMEGRKQENHEKIRPGRKMTRHQGGQKNFASLPRGLRCCVCVPHGTEDGKKDREVESNTRYIDYYILTWELGASDISETIIFRGSENILG